MDTNVTKQEILDWINFLYKDLLNHRVYIGGFYFTFDQLDNFNSKLRGIERKIRRANNELNINSHILQKNVLKSLSEALKLKNECLKKEIDFIPVKIKAINRHNETINLSCTYEELEFVVNQLTYSLDSVEHFHNFLVEEVENLTEEDKKCFFVFINDLLKDVKDQLDGKIQPKKVVVALIPPKVEKTTK